MGAGYAGYAAFLKKSLAKDFHHGVIKTKYT